MFKRFQSVLILAFISMALVSCGKSDSKKKKNSNTNSNPSTESQNTDDMSSNTKDDSFEFLADEREGFEKRKPTLFKLQGADEKLGDRYLVYYPAVEASRHESDKEERWYFYNPEVPAFDHQDSDPGSIYDNIAFRVYPKEDSKSLKFFSFELAPKDDVVSDLIDKNSTLELIETSGQMMVKVTCGTVVASYEHAPYAGDNTLQLYPLNSDDNSYEHFESPCSYYTQQEIKEGLYYGPENEAASNENIQVGDDANSSADSNDEDEEICIEDESNESAPPKPSCEKPEISCGESLLMRYHVKVICRNYGRDCSHTVTPVGIINADQASENSCEQTEAVVSESLKPAGEMSNLELLPYCPKGAVHRRYFKLNEKIESIEDDIAAKVEYCAHRPDLGSHCEAVKIHDLQKKIERKKKEQAQIINECIDRRNKDAAKGNYSQPEINTCGLIKRFSLTSNRNAKNKLVAKLNHENALCQSNQGCAKDKIEKLESKIQNRDERILKLEKKCNVR